MNSFPSLSLWGVLLAALACFAWGGVYWGALSLRIAKAVGLPAETEKMPPTALIVAFVTRVVLATGFAAILGYAGVRGFGVGLLGGAALFTVTLLPLLIGQAAFAQEGTRWRRLAITVPDGMVGCALIGAIVGMLP